MNKRDLILAKKTFEANQMKAPASRVRQRQRNSGTSYGNIVNFFRQFRNIKINDEFTFLLFDLDVSEKIHQATQEKSDQLHPLVTHSHSNHHTGSFSPMVTDKQRPHTVSYTAAVSYIYYYITFIAYHNWL
jgi:hypothetical protein